MKTVFWSHFCLPSFLPKMKLLSGSPKKLSTEIKKDMIISNRNLALCPASNELFNNTYYLTFNQDLDEDFDENGYPQQNKKQLFLQREKQFQNRISVELDFAWIFYSSEPLMLEVFPPFCHQTTLQNFGCIASGRYDIGKWFRPINLSFFLWEGINKFKAKEGEPICYIRFISETPIKLQEFYINQRLLEIGQNSTNHPNFYKKNIPLLKRYEKFKESNMKHLIEKEINNNLGELNEN